MQVTDFAWVFPGQGSQTIGMGKALADSFPAAREVFERVDGALGESLSALVWSGDQAELTLTRNAQPALMAVSVAVMRALEAEFGVTVGAGRFVAGHSLGEYSALAASGALALEDAARLLRLRGDAMQAAVGPGEGAMAALLGASLELAEAACAAAAAQGPVSIANDNADGQVVISGAKAAVEAACEAARAEGLKKAVMLPVSAPFHCALMAPAAEAMRSALAEVPLHAPSPQIVANVTAGAVSEPETIRRLLVEQVTGRVRWRESVQWMSGAGAGLFVEAGAGKVLSVMAKRIVRDAETVALNDPEDLEAFALRLRG